MSSATAIAGVTAVLKYLLDNELKKQDLAGVIGSYSVSALPPDRITTGAQEPNQLNLFLYQMTSNPGWRNTGLPAYDSTGQQRLTNPPLALDLHYLLTAYGAEDYHAEILLGYAMQAFHELPILSRREIRTVLKPPSNNLPPFGELPAEDLADQVESLKITPQYLPTEELSKLWTAMQARYRQSMAYQVSVVLIQATQPTKTPLPVLQVGKDNAGIRSQPSLAMPTPPFPVLTGLIIQDAKLHHARPSAELGDTIILSGHHLSGGEVKVRFNHPHIANPRELEPQPESSDTQVLVKIPNASDVPIAPRRWPAGVYSVAVHIKRPDKPEVITNELPFTLAPQITTPLPLELKRDGNGNLTIQLSCSPEVRPKQRVSLLLGSREVNAEKREVGTNELTFIVKEAPLTETPTPLRLRVDGVDSLLIRDYAAKPLAFDLKQMVTIT